jgi:hypothetical protein
MTQREQKHPPFLIPCPICHGIEGCDHTVLERARAASEKRRTDGEVRTGDKAQS